MRIIEGLEALARPLARSVVAIGKFDGVHRGHQALIHAAVARARAENAESVVATFDRGHAVHAGALVAGVSMG